MVYEIVAVSILDVGPPATPNEERPAAYGAEGSHGAVHASHQALLGLGEQSL